MDDVGDSGGGSAMQFLSCGRLFSHALDQFNSRLNASISTLSAAIETVENSLVRPHEYQKPRVFVPGGAFFSAPHGSVGFEFCSEDAEIRDYFTKVGQLLRGKRWRVQDDHHLMLAVWDSLVALFYTRILEEKSRREARHSTGPARVTLCADQDLDLAWSVCVRLDKSNDHAFWVHVQKLYTGSPSHSLADLRMRWFNFLCPTIKQCAWAPAEDAALVQFLNASTAANQPFDWMAAAAAVSSAVPSDRQASLLPATRTPASCLMRYARVHQPGQTRRWSEHEDRLLCELVAAYGTRWKTISLAFQQRGINRDRRSLMVHWLQVVQPLQRGRCGRWEKDEDQRLKAAVARHGAKWASVSSAVRTRSGTQCRERWVNCLKPAVNGQVWTAANDALLRQLVQELQQSWAARDNIPLGLAAPATGGGAAPAPAPAPAPALSGSAATASPARNILSSKSFPWRQVAQNLGGLLEAHAARYSLHAVTNFTDVYTDRQVKNRWLYLCRNDEKDEFEADVETAWRKLTGGARAPQRFDHGTWTAVLKRMTDVYGEVCSGGGGEGLEGEEEVVVEEEEEEEAVAAAAAASALAQADAEQPRAIKRFRYFNFDSLMNPRRLFICMKQRLGKSSGK